MSTTSKMTVVAAFGGLASSSRSDPLLRRTTITLRYTTLTRIRTHSSQYLRKSGSAVDLSFELPAPETCRNRNASRPSNLALPAIWDIPNSFEAPCRSHENEEGVNEMVKPTTHAPLTLLCRPIAESGLPMNTRRRRGGLIRPLVPILGINPPPQAEDIRKKDCADQPARWEGSWSVKKGVMI